MPVGHILEVAGKRMGLNKNDPNQRKTLVRFLNEAAQELYDQADMVGILMEQVFKVNGDQTITCPWYVGPIRGVREYASMQVWHINRMRPRYNQFNWPDMWRNIRIRNIQALQASLVAKSKIVVFTPQIETPPIQVTIVGPSDLASNTIETLTLDNSCTVVNGGFTKTTSNSFNDVTTVFKNEINAFNILLSDVNGAQLTILPNCQYEALYQMWDISACPWLPQNTSILDNYLEIIYKQALPILYNDEDSFPSKTNYDYILVNKMLQLWYEEQKNPQIAQAYDAKATRSLARKQEDQNHSAEDVIALVANPHDTLLKRIGTGLRRRYSLYAGRKY
jgi:hypothetical protein